MVYKGVGSKFVASSCSGRMLHAKGKSFTSSSNPKLTSTYQCTALNDQKINTASLTIFSKQDSPKKNKKDIFG